MSKLYNLARVNTTTTGTGTITLGTPVVGFLAFSSAGVVDGDTVSYGIFDGANSETGTGVYTSSGTTLTRSVTVSTNSNNPISLTGQAQVYITPRAEDFASLVNIGEIKFIAYNRVPAFFLSCDGSQVSRTTYAALYAVLVVSSAVTITNASPAVVTWTGNQLRDSDPILLTTTGTLPTGLSTGTKYYVVSNAVDGTDKFRLATSPGGTAINTSSAGSGVHTAINAPWEGTAIGNGSTTFTLPDLRGSFVRSADNSSGFDFLRSFGTLQTDAFQGHIHSNTGLNSVNSTNAGFGTSNAPTVNAFLNKDVAITVGNPTTDGSNGTPRTAPETRPRNQTMLGVIRYAAY
jgi:microcystin-dependent protein